MFTIARDYLSILGLEVDVKRLFNIAREILELCCTLMSAKTLRALVLLKDFIRCQVARQV